MVRSDFDIAVVGSGFAGSLLAMIARKSGRSVLMLERGKHPRFAIGESSTPLANLILERLALRYDLPRVRPLAKWGSWQAQLPQVAGGLKRGFTFYHHEFGQPWKESRARQLLVGASPHDRIADTHWYRPDFDAYLANEAQAQGVDYLDQVQLESIRLGQPVTLRGQRDGEPLTVRARWVVDATGPRGTLHRLLKVPARPLQHMPHTQALYSHFEGVYRWQKLFPPPPSPPYPPDDAALHHVFPGGWIWVLRFNNGLTSAGVAAAPALAAELQLHQGAPAWQRLLDRLPAVATHFREAKPTLPFIHQERVAFRSAAVTGPGWIMLPSAAGFIDPLLSTGFPLTLLGIERLALLFGEHWERPEFFARLRRYARLTQAELLVTERLVAALYACMDRFELFSALVLLYLAAASYTETVRRLDRPELAGPAFLCSSHPVFGPRMRACLSELLSRRQKRTDAQLLEELRALVEPIDVAGLHDESRNNWYPVLADDLFQGAHKVGATREEIQAMLQAVGFCGRPTET
jgi:FADH2 O2-dependent halogenase